MQKTPDFMPEFRANLPKHDHVLSHYFNFTCLPGHLNPIFHTIVNPGDTIKIGFDYNIRTQPLEAAAFGDFITHVEYFFVPMQLLYQPFDSVYYGISDQFSSAFDSQYINRLLPVLDFDSMTTKLYNYRANWILYPDQATPLESFGQSSVRLFDMLAFNPTGIAEGAGSYKYNPNVFPYQFLAYNCIYQYIYRLDTREKFNSACFNWDSYYTYGNTPVDASLMDIRWFCMRYRPLENDYFTDVKVSPIVDVLNLTDKSDLSVANQWLTRRTFMNSSGNTPDVISSGSIGSPANTSGGHAPTGSLMRNPSNYIQTVFGMRQGLIDINSDNTTSLNGADINTANIRAMFANEKLWSITGRAKKNYDDQTLAHFGYHVPHDVKHQISKFGHDIGRIHVGEVISTSNTYSGGSGSPLGEIAGKGYGHQEGVKHSFTAPCHGVIMAIFSVEVVRNYEAGVARYNAVASRDDLYVPEYDHLGMQPLFYYECAYDTNGSSWLNNIQGWQYRYEQWKRRYNRCTAAFRNGGNGSLRGWLPTFNAYNGVPGYPASPTNTDTPNTESYMSFVNLPTDGNQLFLAQYPSNWSTVYEDPVQGGWSHIYDFDPFVVNGFINCVNVSVMSDFSLPRLDA